MIVVKQVRDLTIKVLNVFEDSGLTSVQQMFVLNYALAGLITSAAHNNLQEGKTIHDVVGQNTRVLTQIVGEMETIKHKVLPEEDTVDHFDPYGDSEQEEVTIEFIPEGMDVEVDGNIIEFPGKKDE
jgi:hypothetical protein